jgi:hypothetical protein
MSSKGKPRTEPMIIEKARSFYDEMKITDMSRFFVTTCDNFGPYRYHLIIWNI